MIVVRLYGGLGNQLFQYSAARKLAIKLNCEVILDTSEFDKPRIFGTKREFELMNFQIAGRLPTNIEEKKIRIQLHKVFGKMPFVRPYSFLKEKSLYKFDERFNRVNGRIYMDGYWQSYKYFENIRDVLINEFQPNFQISQIAKNFYSEMKDVNSVALHVRRGDYVSDIKTATYHGICGLEYFNAAIKIIKSKIDRPVFYIFSDDIEWASKYIKIESEKYFMNNHVMKFSPSQDLLLMASCKHQVIANSSFSWWSAWLNNNKSKFVIYPGDWLKNSRVDLSDLIPNDWHKT